MATSTLGSRSSTFKYNETTTAPAVTDDAAAGYSIGSEWYDTTADKGYVCLDTTNGAAVWKETTASGGGGGGSVATDTIWDAKGDLAGGTGSDTAARLAVGTNNYVLIADSAQTTGLKWGVASSVVKDDSELHIAISVFH